MKKWILDQLKNNPAVQSFNSQENNLASLSLYEEALIISTAFQENKSQSKIIVKNNLYQAQQLYNSVANLIGEENVVLYGVEESLRVEAIAASPETLALKVETMAKIVENKVKLCITHASALTRYLPSADLFDQVTLNISIEQEMSMNFVKEQLIKSGYQFVARVDHPLTFAMRGGIIDIYSINYQHPIRIEFFDVVVESIRFFDISSQRTINQVDTVKIIPATDILFSDIEIEKISEKVNRELQTQIKHDQFESLTHHIQQDLDYLKAHMASTRLYAYFSYLENASTIVDYFENPILYLSTKDAINQSLKRVTEETIEFVQEMAQEGKMFLKFSLFAQFDRVILNHSVVELKDFYNDKNDVRSQITQVNLPPQQPLATSLKIIEKQAQSKKVVLALNETEMKLTIEALLEKGMPYSILLDQMEVGLYLINDVIEEGFEANFENLVVYSSKELFNNKAKIGRFANKFKEAEMLNSYLDLKAGDYIVHNLYGVGKYIGIISKVVDDCNKDYLNIAFKGDDALLVPLEQFKLVRKFVSREGVHPKLNKLGTNEWQKTKEKLKANVDNIAERLIELYSSREEDIGYQYQADTELQKEFEKDFPYELTIDQKQATEEIKQDMMRKKPMDRLLCGDVGFGKTEVAFRVAFKAVAEGKQVAFLCPTTILARQHYVTCLQRFKNFPVKIEMLSRFVVPSKQKEVIAETKLGNVDILIGTHRMLSNSVEYKDLGLLIIDEEQRFGVAHKEKIKEMRKHLDVLSLSATPIPRTLQMSLIGIRSLSQLDTPPNNRMPVQTYVIEKNKSIVREIIQRELGRNGQVFYLFNNVSQIYSVASQIQKEIPNVNIAVAHGKMNREEIEDVMYRFTNNEYNVLICTTIIETGIDIPNANTIIIDQADRFGLSQLYQIKGRVGRSDRLAYAYLMYNANKQLSEIAQKRLQAIKEFTELGSGYKIAMRDLTIRGAGDMLGAEQSGFIDTVGIDMYIELLNEAIKEKKGIKIEKPVEMQKANLKLDAYIPETFAPRDFEKITLYQRIDQTKDAHELNELILEVNDNYGKLPKSVKLLFEKKQFELLLNEESIDTFKEIKETFEVVFKKEWSSQIDGVKLFEIINKISQDIQLRYTNERIQLKFTKRRDWLTQVIKVLEKIKTEM